MYWSDVYSSNASEKLMREERAVRNIDRRMRAYHAGRYGTRRKPTTRKPSISKPTIRKSPVNKKADTIVLPALPQKLIITATMMFVTMFAAVTVSFAATNTHTEMMPEVRNDIMQEDATQTETTVESDGVDYSAAAEEVSADTPVVQEPVEKPTTTELTAGAAEEIVSEPAPDIASNTSAPALTVSQSSSDVDHTPIWQNVSAYDFTLLDLDEKVDMIGAMAHDDELATGIPAELTAAQMILESGWMESGLTQQANNCFGIKASSGGYNWDNSTWDGTSVAEMETQEEYEVGEITTIVDGFRAYNSVWDSVTDHSAYLLNSGLYPGIADSGKSLDEVLGILVDGGYATGSDYDDEIKKIIETYDLTRFGC